MRGIKRTLAMLAAGTLTLSAAQADAGAVPGFDPVRDVPSMENWDPETDLESNAGHCFAMTLLTELFYSHLALTPGSPRVTPTDAGPLPLDDQGIRLALAAAFDDEDARVPVGPATSLREWTAAGSPGEAQFRRLAEAIQYRVQAYTHFGPFVWKMIRSSIGGDANDLRARRKVNARAMDFVRERIDAGRPAGVCLLPGKVSADGHVVLAHAYRVTPTATEVELYDCNVPPVDGVAHTRTLVVDHDTGAVKVLEPDGSDAYPERFGLVAPIRSDRGRVRRRLLRVLRNVDRARRKTRRTLDNLAKLQEWFGELFG